MTQDFPLITISQVVMIRNDLYTGVVVDINMKVAIEKSQEIWTVYDLKENAIRDAKIIVKNYGYIECSIFDKDRKLLELIQPEVPKGERINYKEEKRDKRDSKLTVLYNYVFKQQELPRWIVNLNYGSLLGILACPVVFFGSIFMFDNPKNESATFTNFVLLNCYSIVLVIVTFLSFKLFRINKIISAVFPSLVIVFYFYLVVKFIFH